MYKPVAARACVSSGYQYLLLSLMALFEVAGAETIIFLLGGSHCLMHCFCHLACIRQQAKVSKLKDGTAHHTYSMLD